MWKVLAYVISLPLLLIISLLSFLYLKYPPASWKNELIKQVAERLETKIEIKDIRYGLNGFLKIKGLGLYIKNNPPPNSRPELWVDELGILFHPSSLWSQKLDIYSLYLHGVKTQIIQNNRGQYNWENLRLLKKFSKKKSPTARDSDQASESFFTQDSIDIQNISLEKITLSIKAPSLTPIPGQYQMNAEIAFTQHKLRFKIEMTTPTKSRVQLNSTLFIPASLFQIMHNYNKIKKEIYLGKLPRSKVNIHFHDFQTSYLGKTLPHKNILKSLDGKVSLTTTSKSKSKNRYQSQIIAKLHKIYFKTNKKYKNLSGFLEGDLLYDMIQKSFHSKTMSLRINDEQNDEKESSIEFTDLFVNSEKQVQFRSNIDLNLKTLQKYLSDDIHVEGRLTGELFYNLPKHPLEASLSLNKVSLVRAGLPILTKNDIIITLLNDKIDVPQTTLNILDQEIFLKAEGSFSKKTGARLKYNLMAKEWNMNKVLDLINKNKKTAQHASAQHQKDETPNSLTNPKNQRTLTKHKNTRPSVTRIRSLFPIDLQGNINFDSFLISKLNLAQFSAKTAFKKNVLDLNKLSFSLQKGTVKGSYQVAFLDEILHTFAFQIQNLKLHKILERFETNNKIYATSSGKVTGTMRGSSLSEVTQSLESEILVKTSKGKMVNTFLQNGLLNGPLGALESKLSHLEFLGSKIKIVTGQGNIYVHSVKLVSDEFSLSVTGKFDWKLFGDAYMRLKFTNRFIENVASVARLKIRSNYHNGQYLFHFSCLQSYILQKECWKLN